MVDKSCFFNWKFYYDNKPEKLIVPGSTRVQSIIKNAKIYGDKAPYYLQEKLDENAIVTIHCHKSCVSSLISSSQVERFRKRAVQTGASSLYKPPKTRKTFSFVVVYSFREHCL